MRQWAGRQGWTLGGAAVLLIGAAVLIISAIDHVWPGGGDRYSVNSETWHNPTLEYKRQMSKGVSDRAVNRCAEIYRSQLPASGVLDRAHLPVMDKIAECSVAYYRDAMKK